MTTKNPFPGMNPFFEQTWRDAHTMLIAYFRDTLQDRLPPDLVARAEEETGAIISDKPAARCRPDVWVTEPFQLKEETATAVAPPSPPATEAIRVFLEEETERWLEIRDSTGRLITAIELLSPSNKRDNREEYLRKRRAYLASRVNLVEIDLVRQGARVFPDAVRDQLRAKNATYAVCVFRAAQPIAYEIYPVGLRERLPVIRVPLRPTDPDVVLDLQPLIDQCHERGRYHFLDYRSDPEPPLSAEDAGWLDGRLRECKLRA